jgi:hypothetical protein
MSGQEQLLERIDALKQEMGEMRTLIVELCTNMVAVRGTVETLGKPTKPAKKSATSQNKSAGYTSRMAYIKFELAREMSPDHAGLTPLCNALRKTKHKNGSADEDIIDYIQRTKKDDIESKPEGTKRWEFIGSSISRVLTKPQREEFDEHMRVYNASLEENDGELQPEARDGSKDVGGSSAPPSRKKATPPMSEIDDAELSAASEDDEADEEPTPPVPAAKPKSKTKKGKSSRPPKPSSK